MEPEQGLLFNVDLTERHPIDLELIDGIVNSLENFIDSQNEVIALIKSEQYDKKNRLESVRGFLETTMILLNNGKKQIKKLINKTIEPELPYKDRSTASGGKKKTRKRRYK
jgi:hypothetical protein